MIPRRKGLARRTRLVATTPLERTRLRSSGPTKPRRRDTGPSQSVREIVRERAGWRCEHCGRADVRLDLHHRRPRAMGGTSDPAANQPSNLVLLCRRSHEHFESERAYALRTGWLVAQGADPAAAPIWLGHRWVLLDDEGRYVDVVGGAA